MKFKYKQRDCDWCTKEWEGYETKPGHVQHVEDGPWEVCGVCEGTASIDDTCYCHAHYNGECCCDYQGWTE